MMLVLEREETPLDYGSAMALPDWRKRVWWPLLPKDMDRMARSQLRSTISALASIDDQQLADAVLLSILSILADARAIAFHAGVVQRAKLERRRIKAVTGEINYLSGMWRETTLPDRSGQRLTAPALRLSKLRAAARAATWNGPSRFVRALVQPGAVAVSHNSLLRHVASRSPIPVGYAYGHLILARARAQTAQSEAFPAVDGIVDTLVTATLECVTLEDELLARARGLMRQSIRAGLVQAMNDVAALRQYQDLPRTIWSATGGEYSARAIGIEVLRRGGEAARFDHSGHTAMVDAAEGLALTELSVSSRFETGSSAAADLVRSASLATAEYHLRQPKCIVHSGDPAFSDVPAQKARSRAPQQPRVVYLSTILAGFRQIHPCLLPDVVYLDWQMRIAQLLQSLPIDLVCKPHPEGLLAGQRHPLADIAPTSTRMFEEIIDEADIFLHDYPASTTFWKALCTDRPIVLVDFGLVRFAPFGDRLIKQRCRIIRPEWDQEGRPWVDRDMLAEAILESSGPCDPSDFRRIFAGEDARNSSSACKEDSLR